MNTPAEWIKNPTATGWLYALDVLRHVLKGDIRDTAFKAKNPNQGCWMRLREAMGQAPEINPEFVELTERTNFRARKRVPQWDETGDLEVGAFIDKEDRCFVDYPKREVPQTNGITVIFDASVPWIERDGDYMLARHHKAYEIAVQAEADGVPCRVIALHTTRIDEFPGTVNRLYMTIKDFNDPIFPGIWGAFKGNDTTNDFNNVVMDYFVGTETSGNGYPTPSEISQDFADDEVVVLEPIGRIIFNPKFQRR